MLTPSEVELLRQDLKSALKVLGQDEIDDAHDLFRRSGFRSTDFEILQRSDPSVPHVIPLRGTAVVIRKSNRIAKTYVAGHLSSWLEQLESDLKLGTFGRPEAAGPDHSLHTAPLPAVVWERGAIRSVRAFVEMADAVPQGARLTRIDGKTKELS